MPGASLGSSWLRSMRRRVGVSASCPWRLHSSESFSKPPQNTTRTLNPWLIRPGAHVPPLGPESQLVSRSAHSPGPAHLPPRLSRLGRDAPALTPFSVYTGLLLFTSQHRGSSSSKAEDWETGAAPLYGTCGKSPSRRDKMAPFMETPMVQLDLV